MNQEDNDKIALIKYLEDLNDDANLYSQLTEPLILEEEVEASIQEMEEATNSYLAEGGIEGEAKAYAYLQEKASLFIPAYEAVQKMLEKIKKD